MDGTLESEREFNEGDLEGRYVLYYKNGQKFREGRIEKKHFIGVFKTWRDDGSLLASGTLKEGKFWQGTFYELAFDRALGSLERNWPSPMFWYVGTFSTYHEGEPVSEKCIYFKPTQYTFQIEVATDKPDCELQE